MIFPNTEHVLRTEYGEEFTAVLKWQGKPKRNAHKLPECYVLLLFEMDGEKVWLNNQNCKLRSGEAKDGKATWFYLCDNNARRKIKKALESAANSI